MYFNMSRVMRGATVDFSEIFPRLWGQTVSTPVTFNERSRNPLLDSTVYMYIYVGIFFHRSLCVTPPRARPPLLFNHGAWWVFVVPRQTNNTADDVYLTPSTPQKQQ